MLTLFAASAVSNPLDNTTSDTHSSMLFGLGIREMLLITGAALAVGLVLFLWAYLTHKNRRHHHSSHHLSRAITRAKKETPEESAVKRLRKRRRRPGHPGNLPRNPTLGETGGLPPIRPEEPPTEVPQV